MLDLLPRWLDDALSAALSPASRWIARRLYGADMPLCALAYARGWRVWLHVFGREHCANSLKEWAR